MQIHKFFSGMLVFKKHKPKTQKNNYGFPMKNNNKNE